MQLKQTIAPLVDPVSLQEVKDYMCNEYDSEDVMIQSLIAAASNLCERFLERSLITQTWTMHIDNYPAEIEMPKGPVQSITSITSLVHDGTTVVNPSADYYLVDSNQYALAVLNYNLDWDTSTLRPRSGVEVVYIAGYGDDPCDIPHGIKQGLLMLVQYLYNQTDKELVKDGSLPEEIPTDIAAIWQPYRVVNL